MSKRHTGIIEELRQAIRQAERQGITRYRIAQISGVEQSQLSKLMQGQRIPRLDTAERIVRALGCRLTITDRH